MLTENYKNIEYFPSYEIMMDDLRDYRFYKEDMIHPSEVAENYIWEKFTEVYFNNETVSVLKEWSTIRKAINHNAFHPDSEEHQNFIKEHIAKAELLAGKIDIQAEIQGLKDSLLIP
jgi:hypothetical protein